MTYPINYDLEKHLLNGCKIIQKGSLVYKSETITHVLIECPADYCKEVDKEQRPVKFISLEVYKGDTEYKWFDMTYHYSTKRHSVKHWHDNLTQDRLDNKNKITISLTVE